jgi:hypothetical protein
MARLEEDPDAVPVHALLRPATIADGWALWRLAHRDSRPLPAGPLVVAEVEGELVAAVSLATGNSIAEPFGSTAAIVDLLKRYAAA